MGYIELCKPTESGDIGDIISFKYRHLSEPPPLRNALLDSFFPIYPPLKIIFDSEGIGFQLYRPLFSELVTKFFNGLPV